MTHLCTVSQFRRCSHRQDTARLWLPTEGSVLSVCLASPRLQAELGMHSRSNTHDCLSRKKTHLFQLLQIWPHYLVRSTYYVPGTLMVINKIRHLLSRSSESSRKDQTNTQRTDSCQIKQNERCERNPEKRTFSSFCLTCAGDFIANLVEANYHMTKRDGRFSWMSRIHSYVFPGNVQTEV